MDKFVVKNKIKETEILHTPFNLSNPLIMILNPIEKLDKMLHKVTFRTQNSKKMILPCNSFKMYVILNKD